MTRPHDAADIDPDFSVHPGLILRATLENKDIRQSELAERTGLSPKHINQIIKGNIGISSDVAVLLEKALGGEAELWINLDLKHALHVSRQRDRARLPEFKSWMKSFDAPTAIRNGIYAKADDDIQKVDKLLKFFGVTSPEAFEESWMRPKVSFRRSQLFEVEEHNTALWLRLVERNANHADVGPFRPATIRKAARSLRQLTNLNVVDGFIAARSTLAEAGVVLTFVREVPKTRMCGATYWLAADRPVIAVTERHKRPDGLWWTIAHECGHVALHPRRTTFLDVDDDTKDDKYGHEAQADDFARTTLLPDGATEKIATAETREDLIRLAANLGVGPPIVAGQYARIMNSWGQPASGLRGAITDTDVVALERAVRQPE
ncbi:MAG: HTH-type transcriptional regulator / antitoxin HigA [Actinomycetota bacterium]